MTSLSRGPDDLGRHTGSLLCRSFHLAHIQVLPSAGQTVQEQAEFRVRHRDPPRPAISEPQVVDAASAHAASRPLRRAPKSTSAALNVSAAFLTYYRNVPGADAPKLGWVSRLPKGSPSKDALGRIIDGNRGLDESENSYYEAFADPGHVRIETARRRFAGQYLRRLRRIAHRGRHSDE